jgi:hypothetical protein
LPGGDLYWSTAARFENCRRGAGICFVMELPLISDDSMMTPVRLDRDGCRG